MAMPLPHKIMWAGRIVGCAVGIVPYLYIEAAFNGNDWARRFIVAIALVFTCYTLVPYAFVRIGFALHKWHHHHNEHKYKPSNLERI